MGKHARPRKSARLPAVPVIAFAVAIVLAGVGAVVVHSVAAGPRHSQTSQASQSSQAGGPDASPAQGVPAGAKSVSSPGVGTPSPDPAPPTPEPTPSVPSGTAFLTSGADGGLAITPAQAETVTFGLWAGRLRALDDGDADTLGQMESGAALKSDLGELAQFPNDPACHCLESWMLQPTSGAAIVPRHMSYPASFVGEVATTDDESGGGNVDVMVITRPGAGSPWAISVASGFAVFDGVSKTFGATGWAEPSRDTALLDGQIGRLADLWQRAKAGDSSGSGGFDPESWLASYRLDDLAAHRQDQPQANGLRAHFTFAVDPAVTPNAVGFKDGAVMCGAIRETVVYTPAPGHAMLQPADRMDFGATIAPGRYTAVTDTADWQVCVGHTRAGLTVPIGYGAWESGLITATPVPPGSAATPDPAQVSSAWLGLLDGGGAILDGLDGAPDGGSGGGSPGGAPVSFLA